MPEGRKPSSLAHPAASAAGRHSVQQAQVEGSGGRQLNRQPSPAGACGRQQQAGLTTRSLSGECRDQPALHAHVALPQQVLNFHAHVAMPQQIPTMHAHSALPQQSNTPQGKRAHQHGRVGPARRL